MNACRRIRCGVQIVSLLAFFAAGAPRVCAQFPPAPGTGTGLPETIEAIDDAGVTTRILYITAHPDDESAAILTYLARGLHANVALLSLTHGEGGQNDLGPEQAPQLGLIRTQELLAATRGYGVKLFFTRAQDFGFSKTPEETEKIWGDQVVEDMVRVIRTFRPNIVINHWGGVHTGHGHHQASGLLTPKAVRLAADPGYKLTGDSKSPLDAPGEIAWGDKAPVVVLDLSRTDKPDGFIPPLDDISPLYGKSWREIGLDAFVNHRTQGITVFLSSPFVRRPIGIVREDGAPFDPAILARPIHEIGGEAEGQECSANAKLCPELRTVEGQIVAAKTAALQLDWSKASEVLASAGENVRSLVEAQAGSPAERELAQARDFLDRALTLAASAEVSADADRDELVAGESFKVSSRTHCRKEAGCKLGDLQLVLPEGMKESQREGDAIKGTQVSVTVGAVNVKRSSWDELDPNDSSLAYVRQPLTVGAHKFYVQTPVTRITSSSTRVDRVPLRMVPAYTLAVEPKEAIEILGEQAKPFEVLLRVHSYATQPAKVSAGVDAPPGWKVSAPVALDFTGQGDRYARVSVTPAGKLNAGSQSLPAYALRGEERFTTSLEPLPTMPTLLWPDPAQCVIRAFDIRVPKNMSVGYVTAESEPVPEALEHLGIRVTMLDAAALAFGDLSKFDAIVLGVRAYELRPDLVAANQRLLDYVSKGGTLVVQYERDFTWNRASFAPYPAKIGSTAQGSPLPRITDENSPVKFLKPDDPLLNRPNKITADDFKGWVQERALYVWSEFDPKYTALLAMNDPGEPDQNGALVYNRYGKGTYIYTGIAFFRQLPEGVPGAYRLFVNLLSASKSETK